MRNRTLRIDPACAGDGGGVPKGMGKEWNMVTGLLTLAQGNSDGMMVLMMQLAFIGLVIAGMWKVFEKAGQPGWAAIVPVYNLYIWTKIVGRPAWFVLLCLVPFLNIIALGVLCWDLARAFGKGVGYAVGLLLLSPVFMVMLGFGAARYQGSAAAGGGKLAPAV